MRANQNKDTPLLSQGPLVLPGQYQIVLRADGRDYHARLSVRADPRVSFDPAGAAAALELAPFTGGEGDTGPRLDPIAEVLCSLHNDLEGSDATPTESQRQVLSASDERLDRALALWQETRGPALARLNDALEGAGLPPIAIPPVEQIHPGEASPGRDRP